MLHTTPQERLALGVVSLLLAAGAGSRWVLAERPAAVWVDSSAAASDTLVEGVPGPVREAAERELARERTRSQPLAAGERIDPNAASVDELQRLPRVGPALAERIAAHRRAHGPFGSLADLDAVPGVGPAMLRSLAPHLTLSASASSAPARGSGAAVLDLNRASAEELEALPGIGPALAERIVEWRTAHGRFRSLGELEQVPGIGPALRARLAPRLRIGA